MSKTKKVIYKMIKNLMPRVITLRNVSLMPGMNQLTEKQFEQNEEQVKLFLRLKQIETKEITAEKAADAPDDEKSLDGINVKEAQVLIDETDDIMTLEAWMENDDRKTVISAIEARIEEINEETAADEDDDEDAEA